MPIRYFLVEYRLTETPHGRRARVEHGATITIQDVIRRIARPGGLRFAALPALPAGLYQLEMRAACP